MGAALKPLLKRLAVGSPAALPTLDLDFLAQVYRVSDGAGGMSSVAFADLITFTRSSAAWRFNASGVLEQVPANQPRFDYDPVTLALRGLLIEEQRTNAISNSSATGAAVGALPTGWSLSLQSGVTGSVVAVGTESGLSYVDIRFQGTIASAGLELSVLPAASVAASVGQAWACSWFVKLVGGSLAGVSETRTRVIARTSGSAYIGSDNTPFTMPVTSQLSACRKGSTYTLPANSALVQAAITAVCAAGPVDFTLRLALPQLELGGVSSPILTTTAQVTRAADMASVNTLSPWFNPEEGTLFVEAIPVGGLVASKGFVSLFSGPANRITLFRPAQADAPFRWYNNPGTPDRGGVVGGSAPDGAVVKGAAAFDSSGYRALSVNGSAVVQASVTGGPDFGAFTTLGIMRSYGTTNELMTGHIRRIRYWPRRLFNDELQRITA